MSIEINIDNENDVYYGYLSYKSNHSIAIDGKIYKSVNHYILSNLFEDTHLEEKISEANYPTFLIIPTYSYTFKRSEIILKKWFDGTIKYNDVLQQDYEIKILNLLERGTIEKFRQSLHLRKKLLSTLNLKLKSKCEILGVLLEQIRDEYIQHDKNLLIKNIDLKSAISYIDENIFIENIYKFTLGKQDFETTDKVIILINYIHYNVFNNTKKQIIKFETSIIALYNILPPFKENRDGYIDKYRKRILEFFHNIYQSIDFTLFYKKYKKSFQDIVFINKKLKENIISDDNYCLSFLLKCFFYWKTLVPQEFNKHIDIYISNIDNKKNYVLLPRKR
jgi:predicted NAD-dependent protein-ADP-ribosyltransferase YbiA (DUF1768 family)